jgi:CDP-diacylglycerol pyrophosphatase
MRFRFVHGLGLGLLAAALSGAGVLMAMTPETARPASELWWVVHDLCVTDQRLLGVPAPCIHVNLPQGWAVVKDTRAPTHLLIVPTRRISGIESPGLLAPDAPNYWQFAWSARRFHARLAGRPVPRQDIALMINSVTGRTQNQLHIHMDCVAPGIAKSLRDHMDEIGDAWRPFTVPLAGHQVLVRRLDGEEFGDQNPFKLLAQGVRRARAHMGDQALGAVGAIFGDGRPGFILIAHAFPLNGEDGREQILDHRCAILSAPPVPAAASALSDTPLG